jgi:citrate lyase subunit beta/citryl-CoA lyase
MAILSVMRSCVFTPAHARRMCEGLWTWGPDAVILDLEDAVPPSKKPEARQLLREHVPLVAMGGATVIVRVNHDTIDEDCEAALWPGVSSIYYPKSEWPEEIRYLDAVISRLERERDILPGSVSIKPLIETAQGIVNAYAIAASSPRIREFGETAEGDMTASLGVPFEVLHEVDVLAYPRGVVDLVARALEKSHLGKLWVQGPTTIVDYGDSNALFHAARLSMGAGFTGQRSAHPAAVEPINRGYTPTEEMESQASESIVCYQKAVTLGQAYGVYKGRIVDAAVAARAKAFCDYADACRAKDQAKMKRTEELKLPDS